MSELGGPAVSELFTWAQTRDLGRDAKRRRVPRLIAPYLPWLTGLPVVKVAGTNGKGSVCAMLSALLRRDGRRPALFTSPHLTRVTERFRVDEREVAAAKLERHAARVLDHARELVRREGDALRPTFFEALLCAGLDLFRDAQADVLVCEAGVGGASDATSLLPGAWGALTTIGLDHQDVLGDTLEAIARDKAGIVGPGAQLVLGPAISPALRDVVAAHAPGVTVLQACSDHLAVMQGSDAKNYVTIQAGGETLNFRVPFLGAHQVDNCAVVVELAQRLAMRGVLRDVRSLAGIEDAHWPGRLELREGTPRVLLDVAHNVEGLQALARALDQLVPYPERVLAFGLSAGKDADGCTALVPSLAPAVYLVEGFHRARATADLGPRLPPGTACLGCFDTPRALVDFARRHARDALRDVTLIAAGSIFMVGDLARALDDAGH